MADGKHKIRINRQVLDQLRRQVESQPKESPEIPIAQEIQTMATLKELPTLKGLSPATKE
jgi:hypothetical protein